MNLGLQIRNIGRLAPNGRDRRGQFSGRDFGRTNPNGGLAEGSGGGRRAPL
jgi:hypothetical protein